MQKFIKHAASLIILTMILVLPYLVFADPISGLDNVAGKGGYKPYASEQEGETALASIVGNIVAVFLSTLGIIFVVLIIYAGYNWMTANGQEEKVSKAQKTLWRSIIGLVIIIGAYAIWAFITYRFLETTASSVQ